MIHVEPFKAKLVREPELRETSRGPVFNMRVRQIAPGKPSMFIDIAVFEEDLAQECQVKLSRDSVIEVLDAGLIYSQWDGPPARKGGKPQPRSKHSLVASEIAFLDDSAEQS